MLTSLPEGDIEIDAQNDIGGIIEVGEEGGVGPHHAIRVEVIGEITCLQDHIWETTIMSVNHDDLSTSQ